jgi:anti-sigma factor RsiW
MFARLSEYLDGELPPELCGEFARHFEACVACEGFTRTLRETIDLCRALPPKPLPESLRHELRALLSQGPRPS